jgi:hypothetical protein
MGIFIDYNIYFTDITITKLGSTDLNSFQVCAELDASQLLSMLLHKAHKEKTI